MPRKRKGGAPDPGAPMVTVIPVKVGNKLRAWLEARRRSSIERLGRNVPLSTALRDLLEEAMLADESAEKVRAGGGAP